MLTALIAAGAARDLLARGPEIPVSTRATKSF
jgi:hypothetical protein